MSNPVETMMAQKLREAFSPSELTIENDSHRHAGHAGSPGTGTSHFSVTMTASVFEGMGRVDRQRKVYAVLAEELAGPVHALALRLKAPTDT